MRPRCCLCRKPPIEVDLEISDLPGSGYRCIDREACKARVASVVSAHKAWAQL